MVPTDSSIGRLAVLIGAASTVTVTAMPTMSPTMSPAPTNSEKPSSNPTISLNPTTSEKPSSAPTVSQLPSLTPSAFPTPECYDSTVALKEAIARADGFSTITYPLCPNTVIDLTGPAFGPNTPPPLVFKSRTHIQCGFNGLLSDNCVIKGGDLFQIEFAGGEFFDFDIFDAKVTGVTFEDAGRAALTASIRGNLLIEDCVFQNHTRGVVAYGSYSKPQVPPGTPLPPIFDGIPDEDFKMDVTFRRVLFKGNSQPLPLPPSAPFGFFFSYGLVTAASGPEPRMNFAFEDCIFEDNEFQGIEDDVALNKGFAVQVQAEGSSVEIQNSCFLNNRFSGDALVLAIDEAGTGNAPGATNFVDEASSQDVFCDFLGTSDVVPDSVSQLTCVDAQSTTCLASIFDDPGTGDDDDDDDNTGDDDDDDSTSSAIQKSWTLVSSFLLLLPLFLLA